MTATLEMVKTIGDIRHDAVGRAINAAYLGKLATARSWARVAQWADRIACSPHAMTDAEWDSVLSGYAAEASR